LREKRMSPWKVALVVMMALATVRDVAARSFVAVKPDEEVCFFEDLTSGEQMRGSYQVIEGGYLDIDLAVIYSRTQAKVVEQFRQEEGTFEFEASEAGRYKVCFGNRLSTNAVKKVQFSIHAGRVDELLENEATENLADKSTVDRLHELVLRLGRRVSDLKEQEEYLRRRSERHQRTTENTGSRVLLSSLCEAAVLVGVNLWQIYYLRRFFEVKRMI